MGVERGVVRAWATHKVRWLPLGARAMAALCAWVACLIYPEQNFNSTFASREQTLLETSKCFLQERAESWVWPGKWKFPRFPQWLLFCDLIRTLDTRFPGTSPWSQSWQAKRRGVWGTLISVSISLSFGALVTVCVCVHINTNNLCKYFLFEKYFLNSILRSQQNWVAETEISHFSS